MKILQIQTKITKWDKTSDNFTGHILDGEKQGFILTPHHPEMKSLFRVTGDIYITDPNTDFVLDIVAESTIQFEPEGNIPTLQELYEVYKEARKDWNIEILKKSMTGKFTLKRDDTPAPYEQLEIYLKQVLQNTYRNN